MANTTDSDRKAPYYLGVDLGGTNIKIGVVDTNGLVLAKTSIPTDPESGLADGIQRIAQACREVTETAGLTIGDIRALGLGSPGPMDLREQIIINPHNLPGWENVHLAKEVGDQLGLPAVLQNDANAAALGEYWKGAGQGCNSLVQFTLGTGIGCGIVIHGKILEGEHSHGGEAGHIRICLTNERLNGTGLYGSLEAYASATAVVDRTKEALSTGVQSVLQSKVRTGEALTARLIFDTARAGDPLANDIVTDTAFYLAIGAVNLMHVIDPDVVVFSGGMIAAGDWFLERIRRFVRENALPVPREKTKIVFARLGNDAGLIGAAGCARSKFETSVS